MNWLQKAAVSLLSRDGWPMAWIGAGRFDGNNFTTNRVTLQQYDDAYSAGGAGALGIATTWACVNLLAGTIGSLPLMVYRGQGSSREVAANHPLYFLLHDSPNAEQTAVDFWELVEASIELKGNAFAQKAMGTAGRVAALTPILCDVTVRRQSDGSLQYEWTENGKQNTSGADGILHIRGFGGGPLGGLSTLAACGRTFGTALSIDNAAAATFRNGVRPSGIVSPPDGARPLTRAQVDEAQLLIEEKYAGAMNAGRPLLLNGLKWQQLTINPEDAQMLESRRFSVEEICRVFGVPPHMIGHTENSTSWGTGLEQQTLAFQKFTLRRRLKRIEQALEKQLLTPADRAAGITIEFNLEGLLRGDSAGRAAFYRSMTSIGAMTINEVRALENMPPVEGGDVPRMQMQNVPITEAGNAVATAA